MIDRWILQVQQIECVVVEHVAFDGVAFGCVDPEAHHADAIRAVPADAVAHHGVRGSSADRYATAEEAVRDLGRRHFRIVHHEVAGDHRFDLRCEQFRLLGVRRQSEPVVSEHRVDHVDPARRIGSVVADRVVLGHGVAHDDIAGLALPYVDPRVGMATHVDVLDQPAPRRERVHAVQPVVVSRHPTHPVALERVAGTAVGRLRIV